LLAVPNVSEGRDRNVIGMIGEAFAGQAVAADTRGGGEEMSGTYPPGVRLLDVHFDADHHRSVYTLAGRAGELADALLRGAEAAVARIDVMGGRLGARSGGADAPSGQHPYVGALDVAPVVYLDSRQRGAACAEALVVADRIGVELGVPVFLYGELAGGDRSSTRADLRRGGVAGLARSMASSGASEMGRRPDFGPARMHPTAGATLVAAREPLVAFNLRLSPPATVEDARGIAALIREDGAEGLPGVRAIGVALSGGAAQVSMNVERPLEIPLARVLEAVGTHAPVRSAELVGLAPRAALEGFPESIPLLGFDASRHLIENALGS
jgi:glutamate formiminotransferase/glutamate formiminotransferase/formiminotetrahydrofolate cyclodeaminase